MNMMPERAAPTYREMLWKGKWWILLIVLLCGGFIAALVAALNLHPKRAAHALAPQYGRTPT